MSKILLFQSKIVILSVAATFIFCTKAQGIGSMIGVSPPGHFPYQVAILYKDEPVCGGALGRSPMGNQFVLTAAHCFNFSNPNHADYAILAGSTTINVSNPAAQMTGIKHNIIHPGYRPWSYEYDIAILMLEKNFVLNTNIQPIRLPYQRQEFTGDVAVTGWGSANQQTSACPQQQPVSQLQWNIGNQLQYVKISLISNPTCQSLYSGCSGNMTKIFQSNICAGSMPGGINYCPGDRGGPVVALGNSRRQDILVGIVSWGPGCGSPDYPAVYTKVSELRSFIYRVTD